MSERTTTLPYGSGTITATITTNNQSNNITDGASSSNDTSPQVIRLKLKKTKIKNDKKVSWTNDTVDNENMNKKKSKCCCIYKKPTEFGESSDSDSDDECDNCRGHVEMKKKIHSNGDCSK